MTATSNFFEWYFFGSTPGAIGGWIVFFILGVVPTLWMLYDSQNRQLEAVGWRMSTVLTAALIIPTIILRVQDYTSTLTQYVEPIFFLGLLGGIVPPVIAAGYYLSFQDSGGFSTPPPPPPDWGDSRQRPSTGPKPVKPARPSRPVESKPKANAWLVSETGKNYELNQGKTTIGRSPRNDISLNDTKVSGTHAQIEERNNHFNLIDLQSTNGTFVNGRRVRETIALDANDKIRVGDNVILIFKK